MPEAPPPPGVRRGGASAPGLWEAAGLALVLVLLALLRPVDHDESQYVAAASLVAHGLWPYRDFVYLQTPLQPWLLAPVALAAGASAWPALRIANALFGTVAIVATYRAARTAGADARGALLGAALFGACDVLLFSIGTARNDALPVALYAVALWLMAGGSQGRGRAAAIGALLAGAAAAKLSYALPAAAYGLYTLVDRRHRPLWVAAGAAPVLGFLLWSYATDPVGSVFGTLTFPRAAPAEYYAGRPWKLSLVAKFGDALKFLALGPALVAAIAVARARRMALFDLLIAAGLVAALLPAPTWRQYLLPVLPPLFVAAALAWCVRPPGRAMRIALVIFVVAGLAPSIEAIARGGTLFAAIQKGRAAGAALDAAGVAGPVATLSPQLLSAARRLPDPRFAAGPFAFRYRGGDERGYVSIETLAGVALPDAVLVGGEAPWTSGDASLDSMLERAAIARGYRPLPAPAPLRLWIRPRVRGGRPPAADNRP